MEDLVTNLPLRTPLTAAAAAFAACILLVAPSHADAIKVGGGTEPQIKNTGSTLKGIDSPTKESGGVKSAPFDPVGVTFPKTTQRGAQPANGQAFRVGGGRRK